jgi:DNA topoisomerase I
MAKNLVIVESPAKAKTIEKYLGKDFVVKSSVGHIRGLPSKPGSVDTKNNFKPKYEIDKGKAKTISELRKSVKASEIVWLASDEDREGEAIAWHLQEVLKLDPKKTKRIVFHEITKEALDKAIKNPREVNQPLVEAQQARQSLDYIVGFELSPVLWRKVRPKLSAGRVQSVATRLVVEREAEITSFEPETSYKITAEFNTKSSELLESLLKDKVAEENQARSTIEQLSKSSFTVDTVAKKPGYRNPSAPFTTSTLQQEASNKLGYSPRATMQLAQKLYESGHITYMRTDSVTLSGQSMAQIANLIKQKHGDKYYQSRAYKSKSVNAQEAHEAIRPTNFNKEAAGNDAQQEKLYRLIWKRAVASQMAAAQIEKTTITIKPKNSDLTLESKGEIVTFDGFMKVYGKFAEDSLLPDIKQGESLTLISAQATETLSKPPARYTEASLVKKLEDMGIGRPSTYASTINTIQARGYVEKTATEGKPVTITIIKLENQEINNVQEEIAYGKDQNKLIPTDTGKVVNDFLVKHFYKVMDYDFTKKIEEELDEIAIGKKDRPEVLKDFYTPFHKLIKASSDISRAEASQAREIGKDPKSGKPIYARYGRFGAMLQKGEKSEEDKPDFAPLPDGTTIDNVTLEQAIEMFKLPRTVGKTQDGQEITSNIGRFGPYIKVGSLFVSIKPLDPMSITLEEALGLYQKKLDDEKEKNINVFDSGIKILKGRFGPYITDGKKNAKIPKDKEPSKITEAEAKELLEKAPAKKGRYGRRKK